MKRKYTRAEIEIIEFDTEDVITTSGGTGEDGGSGMLNYYTEINLSE